MKDRYAGDPALCAKRGRRSTALMAARSRAWLFSAAQNGGRYLRPHRPQGPRHSISSDCRRTVPVGPSTASVYRPPPGNWQSRWSTKSQWRCTLSQNSSFPQDDRPVPLYIFVKPRSGGNAGLGSAWLTRLRGLAVPFRSGAAIPRRTRARPRGCVPKRHKGDRRQRLEFVRDGGHAANGWG